MRKKLKITKLCDDDNLIPYYATKGSAGIDLHANVLCDTLISPGETKKIPTGISVEIPSGYYGAVYARSGLATKNGLRPANCVGVIDSDYRGEIIVPLHNDSGDTQVIKHLDRVAQLIIMPYERVKITVKPYLSVTDRGNGGFGSTGK